MLANLPMGFFSKTQKQKPADIDHKHLQMTIYYIFNISIFSFAELQKFGFGFKNLLYLHPGNLT